MLKTSAHEIKKLLGIHRYMGIFAFPRLNLYWRQNTRSAVVAEVIARDTFTTLRSALNFVLKDQPTCAEEGLYPLWKVQPVINKFKEACRKLAKVLSYYSVDEQMIAFTGRCNLRQVVRSKPRPVVALKNFVPSTS